MYGWQHFLVLLLVSVPALAGLHAEKGLSIIPDPPKPSYLKSDFSSLPSSKSEYSGQDPSFTEQQAEQASREFAAMEEVIRAQIEDFRDFDFSKAYYAYTSSDFQKAFSVDVFKSFARYNPTLFRNDIFVVESTDFEGLMGMIKGKLASSDGNLAQVEYNLIQENGTWKIRKIDITPVINHRKR